MAAAPDRGHDEHMHTSTKLTLLACSLGLALGGCARTSPDRARTDSPDELEPMTVDPVIDSVGNSERLKPTPGADQPAPKTQDIGNPGDRTNDNEPDDPMDTRDDDTIGPNRTNPGVPPPSR